MSSSDATGEAGGKRVPPAPVIAAIVYVGLWAVSFVVPGIGLAIAGGEPAAALLALGGLLPGATALGLWQGNRGARVVAILFLRGRARPAAARRPQVVPCLVRP
jgi:hypothetical protein